MSRLEFHPEAFDLEEVADSLADQVKQSISSQPGDRWNKTGKLLGSIRSAASGDGTAAVVASADRLQDDELAQRFADEVLANDLDSHTRQVLERQLHQLFTVEE